MLKLSYSNLHLECGTDEAGRGCLAVPVVAASVILSNELKLGDTTLFNQINDSKRIPKDLRYQLAEFIKENCIDCSIALIQPNVIDKINILNASILAMQESILKLRPHPLQIIIDGNRFSEVSPEVSKQQINPKSGFFQSIPYQTIIKGDSLYLSIAAASILAKTYRDNYMFALHEEYPMYNWKKNKGYPTKEHREAILKYGTTKYHRMSFNLLPKN